jgi:hypothetical protein
MYDEIRKELEKQLPTELVQKLLETYIKIKEITT